MYLNAGALKVQILLSGGAWYLNELISYTSNLTPVVVQNHLLTGKNWLTETDIQPWGILSTNHADNNSAAE